MGGCHPAGGRRGGCGSGDNGGVGWGWEGDPLLGYLLFSHAVEYIFFYGGGFSSVRGWWPINGFR